MQKINSTIYREGSEKKGAAFPPINNPQALSPVMSNERARVLTNNLSAFERLLSEISATYINISMERLENVLRDDFRRLTQALGFDTCMLYMADESSTDLTKLSVVVWFVDEDQDYGKVGACWVKQHATIDTKGFPYAFIRWNRGEILALDELENIPENASEEILSFKELGLKSCLSIPLSFGGYVSGAIIAATYQVCRTWPDDLISRLRLLGEVFTNAIMRKRADEKLHNALSEISQLKKQFEADYLYLSEEIRVENNFEGIVGQSDTLNKILRRVKQVAPTNATALILGETGTGKGLIARAIHDLSSRKERPLVQVNCAALAPSLIESELFGHEKGAFTGATVKRLGRFEVAKGTTLFLDEIGDIPLELQAKLLRVLEEGEFERVGGSSTIHTEVRLIAATSKDLQKEVNAGRFRRDLLYRLNIFPIFVPPLRERLDDIPLFVEYFVEKFCMGSGKEFKSIPVAIIKALQSYSWPGNIRELKNVVERAVIMSPGNKLLVDIPQTYGKSSESDWDLKQLVENVERDKIIKALEHTKWLIEGKRGAAQRLGFTPSTLRYKMNKLGIKRFE